MYAYEFSLLFDIFPIMFIIIFVITIGAIIISFIKSIKEGNRNNNSPTLNVQATVIAKRTDITYYHHHHTGESNRMEHTTSSTSYYVTFQVESGDRIEFLVHNYEYGILTEGDTGKLIFQGSRYKGFERDNIL